MGALQELPRSSSVLYRTYSRDWGQALTFLALTGSKSACEIPEKFLKRPSCAPGRGLSPITRVGRTRVTGDRPCPQSRGWGART